MKSPTNNERLRALIQGHGLTRREASELMRLSVTSSGRTPALDKYLSKQTDAGNFRRMPDAYLELLELKLGERRLRRFK